MKTISTSLFRSNLNAVTTQVLKTKQPVVVQTHNKGKFVVAHYTDPNEPDMDESMQLIMTGGAFDFLYTEPDNYTVNDLIAHYDHKT